MLFSARRAKSSLPQVIDAWGYAGTFLIVVLGNVGLPAPDETMLTLGGSQRRVIDEPERTFFRPAA
jgi:hypothetical protein